MKLHKKIMDIRQPQPPLGTLPTASYMLGFLDAKLIAAELANEAYRETKSLRDALEDILHLIDDSDYTTLIETDAAKKLLMSITPND